MSSLNAMPIRNACLAGLCASLALLSGCSRDPSSGASTETTNGLMGMVTDENGKPAARAKVTAWDADGRSRLGTALTDSSGHWRIEGLSGVVGIDVISSDAELGAWRGGHQWSAKVDTLPDIRLRKLVNLATTRQKLSRLAGTPYISFDGLLRSIPIGSYTVLGDTSPRSFPVGSVRCSRSPSDTFVANSDSGFLVEDFDDGDSTWIYGPVRNNASRWFAQTSPSGATFALPMLADSTASAGFDTTSAWRGRSLRFKYTVADTGAFVQVGMHFMGMVDLSKLRQIRLRVKGDGILRLAMHGNDSMGGARAVWQISPTSSWSQAVLKVGSELPAGTSDPRRQSFQKLSSRCHALMLQAYAGSTMQIDDIRLDGIEPSAFLP